MTKKVQALSKVISFPSTSVPDAEARSAALNIRASCIVEAPAGSGKTGLLVQRYLKLLADESVEAPEEVLAVTFTRKATAELRERVMQQLSEAHANKTLAADAAPFEQQSREFARATLQRSEQRGWQLLQQPLRLNIRTFDAVAKQIANALPILSASGGPREPVEDPRRMYRAAARQTLLQLGGADTTLHSALRTVLLYRDGNLNDAESLIAGMLEKREQWGELIPLGQTLNDTELDAVVRPRLEAALESIVCNGLSRALAVIPPPLLQDIAAVGAQIGDTPPYKEKTPILAICANKHVPPEAKAEQLDHWLALIEMLLTQDDAWRKAPNRGHLGHDFDQAGSASLKRLFADLAAHPLSDNILKSLQDVRCLPPARYPDDQWHVAKVLFHVLRHALAELKLIFAERGECDFTELALAAREVLRSDSTAADVALSIGGHLRHLLIDEMQDTSAGQYELIELLTRSWDGGAQTLFLVGDPKQSIYLFRAANVERFLRTMADERLGDIPLTALRLTANFRSQAALVQDFNHSFVRLFLGTGSATEAMDVPFVAATASRDQTLSEGVVWHPKILSDEDTDHHHKEAQEIRRIIEMQLAQSLPRDREKPWRIAVLGHGRRHLDTVVAELKIGRIPFKAINLDSLEERSEVLDALALTRALLHPSDRIAWLAVLRAPWCGLSRADLLALTGDSEGTDSPLALLIAAHRDRLSAEGQVLLARVWPVLETAVAMLGRTSMATHAERTWRSLGGDVMLAPEQQDNVLRYFRVLRELETEGGRVDTVELMSRLASLYAEPLPGDPPVELLTIHKAKGLEWDLVLVPGLERGSGLTRHPLLNWLEFDPHSPEEEAAVILAPISSKGTSASKLSDWLTGLRGRREAAERKRLFYVAVTRAKEQVHLFAAVKRTNSGIGKGASASLLNACWDAAEEHFAEVADNVVAMPKPQDLPLAIAAGAEPTVHFLRRMPLSYDPSARFTKALAHKLPYPPASALPQAKAFDRPEGSFAVRAFGNVVHRYLQLMADRLIHDAMPVLTAELPSWRQRLETSLRGEGLRPRDAAREAGRALEALTRTMNSATGVWLLSPHTQAASESALTAVVPVPLGLRVDRTFLAGPQPLEDGESTIWIIDYKTTDQGSLPDEAFAAVQRSRYSAQLEAYATVRRKLPDGALPIRLGLYFPLTSQLVHWPAASEPDV